MRFRPGVFVSCLMYIVMSTVVETSENQKNIEMRMGGVPLLLHCDFAGYFANFYNVVAFSQIERYFACAAFEVYLFYFCAYNAVYDNGRVRFSIADKEGVRFDPYLNALLRGGVCFCGHCCGSGYKKER